MGKYIITFLGQGSQSIGMMDSLAHIPIVKKTFIEASEVLNKDFWAMTLSENEEINQTINTQPLMLIAGIAIWRYLQENDLASPSFIAGHSLGEFTALVAANSLTFTSALKVVTKRAELMQNAVPENEGGMAAILGLEDEKVVSICEQEQGGGILEAVNFNSPGQVVIAGSKVILEKSLESFKHAGAKRALLLPVSVPSHCKLMEPASEKFKEVLNSINIRAPKCDVMQNVDAAISSSVEEISANLISQIYKPVRWTDIMQSFNEVSIGKCIECGPGKVLSGLMKRTLKDTKIISLDDYESFLDKESLI